MKMRRLYNTCIRDDGAALVQWEEMKLCAPGICCYYHFAFSFDSGKFCLLICFLPIAHYCCPLLSKCPCAFPLPLHLSLPLLLLSPLLSSHACMCVAALSLSIRLCFCCPFMLHEDLCLGLAWDVVYWKNNNPKGFGSFFRNQYLGIMWNSSGIVYRGNFYVLCNFSIVCRAF